MSFTLGSAGGPRSFSLGGGLGTNNMTAGGGFGLTGGGANGLFDSGQKIGGTGTGGGGKSGGGGNVAGSFASFVSDIMDANATAKAGGARASGLARQGLNTMAQDKGMGLGKQRRLGYWLGG